MAVTSDAELREVLGLQRLAVIGCSATPGKDAHRIPKYLQQHGYEVIPVNPNHDTVLGEEACDSLAEVEEEVDVAVVFRPSEEVGDVVDAAIERGDVKVIWTQLGIRDDEAARRAEEAGLRVVQDACTMVEHRRLVG